MNKINIPILQEPKIKKNTRDSYVEYYFYVEKDGKQIRERGRIYLTRFKGREFQRVAKQMKDEIWQKQLSGWHPLKDYKSKHEAILVLEAVKTYKTVKERELRKAAFKTIISMMNKLERYAAAENIGACYNLTPERCKQMMMVLATNQNHSTKTFNNILSSFKTFGNWCVSAGYMSANPWHGIKKLKTEPKKRTPISDFNLRRIESYFSARYPEMNVINDLIYFCGFRPKEVMNLTTDHINLEENTIFKEWTFSKNKKNNVHTVPEVCINRIATHIKNAPKGSFLFSKNLVPGNEPGSTRVSQKRWFAMRKELGLNENIKQYSLRDTGIINMLNSGISPERVMKQFHHSSLEITTIYAKHLNKEADERIKALKLSD